MPDLNHDPDGGDQHQVTLPDGARGFTSYDIDGREQHHVMLPGRAHPLTFTIEQRPGIQMPPGWDPMPKGWARQGWLLWAALVWAASVAVSLTLVGWPLAPIGLPQRLLGELLPLAVAVLATVVIRSTWARRLNARLFAEIHARDSA